MSLTVKGLADMTAGRPPKPIEQKRAMGNPGKRPLPDRRSTIAIGPATPKPPTGLGVAGRKMWRAVTSLKWVAETDQVALTELCLLADQVAIARKDMDENGQWYEVRGRQLVRPSWQIYNTGVVQMAKMLSMFGLTPADRTKLGIAEIKAESKFDELMSRRNARGA